MTYREHRQMDQEASEYEMEHPKSPSRVCCRECGLWVTDWREGEEDEEGNPYYCIPCAREQEDSCPRCYDLNADTCGCDPDEQAAFRELS